MTDYFALLKIARSPWLESDQVKARFLELSAPCHPDRVHGQPGATEAGQRFADLNAAAACLREPRDRLQHLLALETGSTNNTLSQNIPTHLIGLFTRIGQACRDVDQFLAERARAASPMIQAQLFAKSLDWSDRISQLQSEVASLKSSAEAELKTISTQWPAEKPLDQLRTLLHHFAAIARWESQLRDRFTSLAAT